MKKFLFILVCFGLLGITAFAQSTRSTRPRVVAVAATSDDKKRFSKSNQTSAGFDRR